MLRWFSIAGVFITGLLPVSSIAATVINKSTCEQYGVYNPAALTCTLEQDLVGPIVLDEDFFTLQGAGFQVVGGESGEPLVAIAAEFVALSDLLLFSDEAGSEVAIEIAADVRGAYLDTVVMTGDFDTFVTSGAQDLTVQYALLQGDVAQTAQRGIVASGGDVLSVSHAQVTAPGGAIVATDITEVSVQHVHAIGANVPGISAVTLSAVVEVILARSSVADWVVGLELVEYDARRPSGPGPAANERPKPWWKRLVPIAYAQSAPGPSDVLGAVPQVLVAATSFFGVLSENSITVSASDAITHGSDGGVANYTTAAGDCTSADGVLCDEVFTPTITTVFGTQLTVPFVSTVAPSVPDPRTTQRCDLSLPGTIVAGESAAGTLTVPAAGRALVTGVGQVGADGSFSVSPATTTPYSAFVWDEIGQVSVCTSLVTVAPSAATPADGAASTTATTTEESTADTARLFDPAVWLSFMTRLWDSWFGSEIVFNPNRALNQSVNDGEGEDENSTNNDAEVGDVEDVPLHVRAAQNAVLLEREPFGYELRGKGWDYSTREFISADVIMSGYRLWDQTVITGLDCSGLIMWAYNRAFDSSVAAGKNFITQEGSWQQAGIEQSRPITESELRPGDFLSFDFQKNDGVVDHVAMYVGEYGSEGVVNASREEIGIQAIALESIKNSRGFLNFHRPFNADPKFKAQVGSPVDMVVHPPQGNSIDRYTEYVGETEAVRGTRSLTYSEQEVGEDGSPDDVVYGDLYPGTYVIEVVPHADALPSDTYDLTVTISGVKLKLAESVPIADIPSAGYVVVVDESLQIVSESTAADVTTAESGRSSVPPASGLATRVIESSQIDIHRRLLLLHVNLLQLVLTGQVSFTAAQPILAELQTYQSTHVYE